MDSKWDEVWKLMSDVKKVDRSWWGGWHVIEDVAEGQTEEEKAKELFCDPSSPWCLDWNKDITDLRQSVSNKLFISLEEDEEEEELHE